MGANLIRLAARRLERPQRRACDRGDGWDVVADSFVVAAAEDFAGQAVDSLLADGLAAFSLESLACSSR